MALWWVNDSGQNTLRGEPAFEASDGTVFKTESQAADYVALYGLSYSVWLDDMGNMGDPENPIHLYNSFILYCIHTVPQAKTDFFLMLPLLNTAEQTRFQRMLDKAPFVLQTRYVEEEVSTAALARRFNCAGIRTAGVYGGTRTGGNL
jgi:hypothetical protein